MPAISASTPAPVMAEPKNTGCTSACLVCAASSLAEPAVRDGRLVVDVRGQQRVVVVGEQLGQPSREVGVGGAVRREAGAARAQVAGRSHRDDRRRQLLGDAPAARARRRAPARSILLTKISVGMRSRCSARISTRVCACTPSTAEITSTAPSSTLSTRSTSAMKSGWPGVSIRLTVTSSIDERHDGGLDGDAALPFQRQRIGLGAAVVDAADLVDDTGGVEQPLGQACLTGVYMRQDPQVQRSCSKRHILRIGREALFDGHERSAHRRSLVDRHRRVAQAGW